MSKVWLRSAVVGVSVFGFSMVYAADAPEGYWQVGQ